MRKHPLVHPGSVFQGWVSGQQVLAIPLVGEVLAVGMSLNWFDLEEHQSIVSGRDQMLLEFGFGLVLRVNIPEGDSSRFSRL